MDSPGGPSQPETPGAFGPGKFPLLDEENAARPWWRRLLIPAAVLVVAAAVAITAVTLTGSHKPGSQVTAAREISVPGRVVSLTKAQNLVVSDTGGTHVTSPSSLTQVGTQVTEALDGKYISLGDGLIVSTSGGKAAMARTAISPFVGGQQGTFGSEPFSDHDQDLLAMTSAADTFNQNSYASVVLKTGKSLRLGVADQASGDPQSAGAFVTIGAKGSGLTAQNTQTTLPDIRAELLIPGKRPVLLGTAATLKREVGMSQNTKVSLIAYPSPSGGEVAIAVLPISRTQFATGVAVLRRTGKLIAKLPPQDNPEGSTLVWSPDGTSVAFQGAGAGGRATLSIWTIGHQVRTIPTPFPRSGNVGFQCLWSPDGKQVLLAASLSTNPNSAATHWAIGKTSGGTMTQVTGPGTPVAWLP